MAKVNRLLINMENKIDVINESIDMLYRMKNRETVTVGKIQGCTEMSFTLSEDCTDEQFNNYIEKLQAERENLEIRVDRMSTRF